MNKKAEAVAEEKICFTCGADIRPEALFCYACGGSLEAELEAYGISSAWLRSDLTQDKKEKTASEIAQIKASPDQDSKKETAAEKTETPYKKKEKEATEEKAKIESKTKGSDAAAKSGSKPKLKTAASIRKKPKNLKDQRIEIVWEEPNNSQNIWFVVFAAIMLLLVAAMFLIAMYLK